MGLVAHASALLGEPVITRPPAITRDECIASGGEVVGDIGDGAVFQPDYVCDNSGAPPANTVVASPGEPIASDGEVCCGGDGTNDEAGTSDESSSSGQQLVPSFGMLIAIMMLAGMA